MVRVLFHKSKERGGGSTIGSPLILPMAFIITPSTLCSMPQELSLYTMFTFDVVICKVVQFLLRKLANFIQFMQCLVFLPAESQWH